MREGMPKGNQKGKKRGRKGEMLTCQGGGGTCSSLVRITKYCVKKTTPKKEKKGGGEHKKQRDRCRSKVHLYSLGCNLI